MDRLKSTTIEELVENLHLAALSGAEATLGKEAVTALAAHIRALEAERDTPRVRLEMAEDAARKGDDARRNAAAMQERIAELEEQINRAEEQEPVAYGEDDGEGNILWDKESCFSDDPEWLDRPMALYAAPVSVPDWQPIETAPKDGAVVLLGMPILGNLRAEDRRVFEGRWCAVQETWTSVNGFILFTGATHWMPLPEAPTKEKS